MVGNKHSSSHCACWLSTTNKHSALQASQWCLATIHELKQILVLAGTSWSALGAHWLVPQDFWDIKDEEWLNTFNVNVMSNVRLCRHFLKPMLERNQVPRPCSTHLHWQCKSTPSLCTKAHHSLLRLQLLQACVFGYMQGCHVARMLKQGQITSTKPRPVMQMCSLGDRGALYLFPSRDMQAMTCSFAFAGADYPDR